MSPAGRTQHTGRGNKKTSGSQQPQQQGSAPQGVGTSSRKWTRASMINSSGTNVSTNGGSVVVARPTAINKPDLSSMNKNKKNSGEDSNAIERIAVQEVGKCGTLVTRKKLLNSAGHNNCSDGQYNSDGTPSTKPDIEEAQLERVHTGSAILYSVSPNGTYYVVIYDGLPPIIIHTESGDTSEFSFEDPEDPSKDLSTDYKKARHIQWSPDESFIIIFFNRDDRDKPNIWIGKVDQKGHSITRHDIILYSRLLNNQWPFYKFTYDGKWAISFSRCSVSVYGVRDGDHIDLVECIKLIDEPLGEGYNICNAHLSPTLDGPDLTIWCQSTELQGVDTTAHSTSMILKQITFNIITREVQLLKTLVVGPSDRIEFIWNSTGSHALVLKHCVVDMELGNYGGTTNLYVLPCDGSTFIRCNKEMCVDAKWNPKMPEEFIMIEGRARNSISCKRYSGRKVLNTFSFPAGYRNTIRYNTFGSMVLLGGYGQMAGDTTLWAKNDDNESWTTIAEWSEACCVQVKWSPSSRFLLMSSTHPRMKVDNFCKVYTNNGELVTQYTSACIYDCEWTGSSIGRRPPPKPTPRISKGFTPESNPLTYKPKGLRKSDGTNNVNGIGGGGGGGSSSATSPIGDALEGLLNEENKSKSKYELMATPRPNNARSQYWDKNLKRWKELDDASLWKKGTKIANNTAPGTEAMTRNLKPDDEDEYNKSEVNGNLGSTDVLTGKKISKGDIINNSFQRSITIDDAAEDRSTAIMIDNNNGNIRPSIGKQLTSQSYSLSQQYEDEMTKKEDNNMIACGDVTDMKKTDSLSNYITTSTTTNNNNNNNNNNNAHNTANLSPKQQQQLQSKQSLNNEDVQSLKQAANNIQTQLQQQNIYAQSINNARNNQQAASMDFVSQSERNGIQSSFHQGTNERNRMYRDLQALKNYQDMQRRHQQLNQLQQQQQQTQQQQTRRQQQQEFNYSLSPYNTANRNNQQQQLHQSNSLPPQHQQSATPPPPLHRLSSASDRTQQSLYTEKVQYCCYGSQKNITDGDVVLKLRNQSEVEHVKSLVDPLYDACWFYVDRQQLLRGPYTREMMEKWYQLNYFTATLLIRCYPFMEFMPLKNFFIVATNRGIAPFSEDGVLSVFPDIKNSYYHRLPPYRAEGGS